MKRRRAAVSVAIAAIALGPAILPRPGEARAAGRAAHDPTATPVLVELFTSEACGKCAAADSVLALIASQQPVDGAEVITIDWHVSLSPVSPPLWMDPFATTFADARHRDYAASLQRSNLYTPQAIVDGATDIPGYNYTRIMRTIARAADQPKPLAVTVASWAAGNDSAAITVLVSAQPMPAPEPGETPPGAAEVMLALVQDGVVSRVTAGENAGRTLRHERVVREWITAGRFDGRETSSPKSYSARIALPRGVDRATLAVVAVVQETASHRVLGVADHTLR